MGGHMKLGEARAGTQRELLTCPRRIALRAGPERGEGSGERLEREDLPGVAAPAQRQPVLADVRSDVDDEVDFPAREESRAVAEGRQVVTEHALMATGLESERLSDPPGS